MSQWSGWQPYGYDDCNNNGYGNTFVLIVVLFILLIIVGAVMWD